MRSAEMATHRRDGPASLLAGGPDHDLRAAPADIDTVDMLEMAVVSGQQLARGIGEVDRVRRALRHALDPRGRVRGVADHRVLETPLGADVPRHHRAAVEADPDTEAF